MYKFRFYSLLKLIGQINIRPKYKRNCSRSDYFCFRSQKPHCNWISMISGWRKWFPNRNCKLIKSIVLQKYTCIYTYHTEKRCIPTSKTADIMNIHAILTSLELLKHAYMLRLWASLRAWEFLQHEEITWSSHDLRGGA